MIADSGFFSFPIQTHTIDSRECPDLQSQSGTVSLTHLDLKFPASPVEQLLGFLVLLNADGHR